MAIIRKILSKNHFQIQQYGLRKIIFILNITGMRTQHFIWFIPQDSPYTMQCLTQATYAFIYER